MVVLDQITEMKKQGLPTSQIMQNLKEQGSSPKEIDEALSQSEIKSEIGRTPQDPQQNVFPNTPEANLNPLVAQPAEAAQPGAPTTQPTTTSSLAEMQPSLGQQTQAHEPAVQEQPSQLATPLPSPQQMPEAGGEQYPEYAPQEYYPEQGYYQEYQAPQSTDIETINDISTQIVEEKIKNFKTQLSSLTKFKNQTDERVKSMEKTMTKIENTLEELQLAVLRKMGDYGEDIKNISKEMKATQNSFSKIINPLTDNARGTKTELTTTKEPAIKSRSKKTETPTTRRRSKKTTTSFEDYLR